MDTAEYTVHMREIISEFERFLVYVHSSQNNQTFDVSASKSSCAELSMTSNNRLQDSQIQFKRFTTETITKEHSGERLPKSTF